MAADIVDILFKMEGGTWEVMDVAPLLSIAPRKEPRLSAAA